jgi:hypothetical protein
MPHEDPVFPYSSTASQAAASTSTTPSESTVSNWKKVCNNEDWEYNKISDDELQIYKTQLNAAYLLDLLENPKNAPGNDISKGFPRKIMRELQTDEERPQKVGWGFVVHMQWDWNTFYITWLVITILLCVADVVLCWWYQWAMAFGLQIGVAILAVVGMSMSSLTTAGKQKDLL